MDTAIRRAEGISFHWIDPSICCHYQVNKLFPQYQGMTIYSSQKKPCISQAGI